MGGPYKEYRCPTCHKLFFKGMLVEGEIEVKCRSCHELSTLAATKGEEFMCLVENCPNRVRVKSAAD